MATEQFCVKHLTQIYYEEKEEVPVTKLQH